MADVQGFEGGDSRVEASTKGVVVTLESRWKSAHGSGIASERADDAETATRRWKVVYGMFSAKKDAEQDKVFAAVNAYFAKNGSSPEGGYTKDITAAGGSVAASEVVKLVGTADGALRKFLRGKLKDSTHTLKYSGDCAADKEMVAEALSYGLPPEEAWLLADWLVPKNAYLTMEEAQVAERIRNHKIVNANMNRGGARVGVGGVRTSDEPQAGVSAVESAARPALTGNSMF